MTESAKGPEPDLPPRNPASNSAQPSGGQSDDVLLTARQQRRAVREERRQAKDAAYELRQLRKKTRDGTFWRGHNIVDARGLANAFPGRESPEFDPITVRRRITHGVVLVLLLALVVAALVLAAMLQRGELELKLGSGSRTPASDACPAELLKLPESKSVTVNVFNGGSNEGRAGQVAAALTERGFVIQEVANKASDYAAEAVIVSGPSGHAAALSMQRNFPNTEYVQDERSDATVDVILTSQFEGLVKSAEVDQKPGVLSCPRLSPRPSPPPSAVPPSAVPAAQP